MVVNFIFQVHIDLVAGLLKVNKVSLRNFLSHAKTQLLQSASRGSGKGLDARDKEEEEDRMKMINLGREKESKAKALAKSQVEKYLSEFEKYVDTEVT